MLHDRKTNMVAKMQYRLNLQPICLIGNTKLVLIIGTFTQFLLNEMKYAFTHLFPYVDTYLSGRFLYDFN